MEYHGTVDDFLTQEIVYSDEKPVMITDEYRTGTIQRTYVGTLSDAKSAAPSLGSSDDSLGDSDLILVKRSFSWRDNVVYCTFTYAVGDTDSSKYTVESIPMSIPLLQSTRYDDCSDDARWIAQEYINGASDVTAIYQVEESDSSDSSDSSDGSDSDDEDSESGSGGSYRTAATQDEIDEGTVTLTTLGAAANSLSGELDTELVKLARSGEKSVSANQITWTETTVTSSRPSYNRLSESSDPDIESWGPRGNDYDWALTSTRVEKLTGDDAEEDLWQIEQTWTTMQENQAPAYSGDESDSD